MKVQFYGCLADAIGHDLEVEPGETVAQLRRRLTADHPRAAADLARSRAVIGDGLVDDARTLEPGDRIEFLPPGVGRMSVVALLEAEALDPQLELAELTEAARGDGAIVSFVGLARPETRSGDAVDAVVLEHHPTLTRQSLEGIAVACGQRFDVSHVRVVHRCGTVPAGEPIVFAGAASLHRRAAFDAADYLMDRLKTEAVFWKREVGDGGSRWIEPAEADFADRERWG